MSHLPTNAFDGCNDVKKTVNGVIYIDSWAVGYTDGITSVTLRDGTYGIAQNAFSKCDTLVSVTLPEELAYIEVSAFYECTALEEINLPESVVYIGSYAFSCCTSLTEITLPDGINAIEEWTFYKCTELSSVNIPESVRSIGRYAFEYCSALTEISLPDGITSLEYGCFRYTGITDLFLPKSLESIENDLCFGHVSGVRHVYFQGTKAQFESKFKEILGSYNTPSVCYYSENMPTDTSNVYWHYVNGEPEIWAV